LQQAGLKEQSVDRIIPSELSGDELWRRNGEYVDAAAYDAAVARIAELEARLSAVIAGAILPADAADEVTVDGVKWVRVPAEARVKFVRNSKE
jgi:hypothetical protein